MGGEGVGYISMVPLYQYQQYNERTESALKTQYPVSEVEQVQRVDIRTKFHKMIEERIHDQYKAPILSEKRNKHIAEKKNDYSYLTAKLTGKGREFSEYA